MKISGMKSIATAGMLAAGVGLSGCEKEPREKNLEYIQQKLSPSTVDSAEAFARRGRFKYTNSEEARMYLADSVRFDSARVADSAKAFNNGKQFILDSLAKLAKVAK